MFVGYDRHVTALVQGYFDGSGQTSGKDLFVTLAGYVGPPEAWAVFDERWRGLLTRLGLTHFHMADANARRGEFKGWSEDRVHAARARLLNECLAPMGWVDFRGQFVGAACTVNLKDYARARADLPALKQKEPQAICVDHVVTVALMTLPSRKSEPFGKAGKVDLCFDQNESFLHKINRMSQRKPSLGPAVLDLIGRLRVGDMRQLPGLQAADLLAWHTNRYRTGGFSAEPLAGAVRVFATPNYEMYFDYEKLLATYGRTERPASGPCATP